MIKVERVFTLSQVARRSLAHSPMPISNVEADFPFAKPRWHLAIVDDLCAAQDLLDRLEQAGRAASELRILGESRFEVRWRDPFSQTQDVR